MAGARSPEWGIGGSLTLLGQREEGLGSRLLGLDERETGERGFGVRRAPADPALGLEARGAVQ